jgi:DNA-binding MarR family transcriptional regulator
MEPDMTAPPLSFGQFGQALAFAERVLTFTLREHLAERNTTPETWYALQLVATRGQGLAREGLARDLEGSRTLDPESTRELLARLEDEGLIHGDAQIDLTAEGKAFHVDLREYISAASVRLLSQFDVDDIETTVRTLQAITARAAEESQINVTSSGA